MIKNLESLADIAKSKKTRKIAVAAAGDYHVLEAIKKATDEGIVEPVLVGNEQEIKRISAEIDFDLNNKVIINVEDPYEASLEAVKLIGEGKADFLMKGLVSSGLLLKAVLNKEFGLRTGSLLSHVAIFETPYYHKLLGVTDAAMNVDPGLEEKIDIIKKFPPVQETIRVGNEVIEVLMDEFDQNLSKLIQYMIENDLKVNSMSRDMASFRKYFQNCKFRPH